MRDWTLDWARACARIVDSVLDLRAVSLPDGRDVDLGLDGVRGYFPDHS